MTGFLQEIILILEEELKDGYITEKEYSNYNELFHLAVKRVLKNYPKLLKEANKMTESVIKLPSQIMDEREAEIKAQMEAQMEEKIAEKDRQLANMEAENRRLQELIAQMASGKQML